MPITLNGTTGEVFPSWTTATRPASPAAGQTGFNTTTGQMETYDGTSWEIYAAASSQGTSGQVLTSSGAGASPTWTTISSSGALVRAPQFLTSGTSYTTPAGCNSILVEMLGGGGGGGTAQNATTYGGGGGSGAYGSVYITAVSPSTTYTIAIGAGGASATAGGNTQIIVGATTYRAGGGGAGGSVTSGSGAAGAAGTALNLSFSFSGIAGGTGTTNEGRYPNYVNFVFGAAPAASGSGVNGISATLYGCSGSGGRGDNSLVRSGGSGTQGWMRIWEYT